MTTKDTILHKAIKNFAISGYEQFNIRDLAREIPVAPSVLYHHFKDKDTLLHEMYLYINTTLGKKRKALSTPASASDMLKQRIEFQIDNSEMIVAVLKYYLSHRKNFKKFKDGFVPDKSSLHIEEVLTYGLKTKEFSVNNLEDDAKVITHAINGFLLEYYPYKPTKLEKEKLVLKIHNFLIRALRGGENK